MGKFKKIHITITVGLLLAVIAYIIFASRSQIIETALDKKIADFEEKTNCKIHYGELSIEGISFFSVKDLLVITPQNDTLLSISSLSTLFNPVSLFHGDKRLERINAEGARLNIVHTNDEKNYAFITNYIIKERQKKETFNPVDTAQSLFKRITHQTQKVAKLHHFLTKIAPKDISIKEWTTHLVTDSMDIQFYLPETQMEQRSFFSQIVLLDKNECSNHEGKNKYYIFKGNLGAKTSDESNIEIYSLNNNSVETPFLRKKFNSFLMFDTLKASLSSKEESDETVWFSGSLSCFNSSFYSPKITGDTISCPTASFNFKTNIKGDKLEIDSSSVIKINDFVVHPHLVWQTEREDHVFSMDVSAPSFEAGKLFSSIPDGLCPHLKGIETSGKLSYDFHFKLDTKEIDSLEFSSALTPHNFNILHFGTTDFRIPNNAFTHHIHENGVEKRAILLSEENPNYVCTDQVSPYLTNSILISEDGLFFHHKGFLESALRASIIQNIKEKKFARGGSTISMQLVKNLWLSKEKTLARKLEEALIVWLIENKRLISKERMFEIYLNIIEWGPDVYGAKEASQYYFEKDPDMLSIEEAIFLTSIIPKPKKFKWSFDKEQNLKPYLADYYKLVASKLLKREIISEKDTVRLIPNVKLTGKAKLLLKGNDSDPTEEDSLHFDGYKNIILQNSDEILPDSTDSTN